MLSVTIFCCGSGRQFHFEIHFNIKRLTCGKNLWIRGLEQIQIANSFFEFYFCTPLGALCSGRFIWANLKTVLTGFTYFPPPNHCVRVLERQIWHENVISKVGFFGKFGNKSSLIHKFLTCGMVCQFDFFPHSVADVIVMWRFFELFDKLFERTFEMQGVILIQ